MTYKLKFIPAALKEWNKLGENLKHGFKKKLFERLENPRIPKDQLRGWQNVYKIKLRSAGYRLVYEVIDSEIVIMVLAVGKRENSEVYKNVFKRISG
jgi:mRNA interferase RelE/StbE